MATALTVLGDRCSLAVRDKILRVAVSQVGQRNVVVPVILVFGLFFVVTKSGSRRRGAVLENTQREGERTS